MFEPYTPDEEEADVFMAQYCGHCIKDAGYRAGYMGCPLIEEELVFGSRPEYPKEWVRDENGPRCLAFEEEK